MTLRNSLCSALTGLALLVSSPEFTTLASAQTLDEKAIYLGSTELGSRTTVPLAGGGGEVEINAKLSFKTSNSTISSINAGINEGKYKEPFADNPEFMKLLLDSNPGCFEIKFTKINYETRLYYLVEDELNKIEKSILKDEDNSENLKKTTRIFVNKLKKGFPNAIRPNDYKGSGLVIEKRFENKMPIMYIKLYSSEKRGHKLIDEVELRGEELKVYEQIKDSLMKKQNESKYKTTRSGSFDDVIKEARKNGIVK